MSIKSEAALQVKCERLQTYLMLTEKKLSQAEKLIRQLESQIKRLEEEIEGDAEGQIHHDGSVDVDVGEQR